jgi:signal transduction histidine kinase/ActR/RegA family two-component response regulator
LADLRERLTRREQELRESQAVAKVGSWTTDLVTLAVSWSLETHHIFGTDPGTFAPTHAGFLELVHPDDRAAVDEAFVRSLGSTEPQEIEHRVVVPGPRPTFVKERWQVFRNAEGRAERAVGTCQDITAQKAAEAERLRSQRLESIGNLAGGIAHDLNNVLAPILMSVALLKEDEKDPERLETLHTVEECAQRGADLVRQVLTYARGRGDVRAPVDMSLLARTVARVLRETFPRGVTIDVDVPSDLPPVLGDVTQLHQVLMNLAVNARDAVDGQGHIALRLGEAMTPQGACVRVEVEDNGAGMSAAVQEQMFDPFFTTKPLGHGTGLGLSTVQSIVSSHGGSIAVSSEVGRGTIFSVLLPATAAVDVPGETVFVDDFPAGANQTVLVVDDEDGILQMARKTLERHGYRVRLARHGGEAVEIFATSPGEIHVVVTDMSMPVMDGPTAIKLLRDIDPHVRIIASSGLESIGGAAKAIGTGSVLFIPKPYSADVLLRAVGKAIAH